MGVKDGARGQTHKDELTRNHADRVRQLCWLVVHRHPPGERRRGVPRVVGRKTSSALRLTLPRRRSDSCYLAAAVAEGGEA